VRRSEFKSELKCNWSGRDERAEVEVAWTVGLEVGFGVGVELVVAT
jgi:hypothetical protein